MEKKTTRWDLAQNYEINWWRKQENGIRSNYFKESAQEIIDEYSKFAQLNEDTRVLEIGSGAFGIVSFISKSKNRFGIDPLEYYYGNVHEFVNKRDTTVTYLTAKGENLPFNDPFDIIILDNVLDHCENPTQVINEVKRLSKKGTFVYFRQNTYNLYGKMMRKIMEMMLIDKGHPFTFTKSNVQSFFSSDYSLKGYNRRGYLSTWLGEVRSRSIKDKIKAILFITRDKATYYWIMK